MTKHTILFLAANPIGTDRRALDLEASSIRRELKRSGYRERFELVTRWAAEPLDLLRELRELKPAVVHFSGQGSQIGLVFQAANGDAQIVSPAAIAETFGAAGSSVQLVVLSACYSDAPADALLAHVNCVVGMSGALHDDMAKAFAIGFYGALGEHESVAAAYRHGNAAISLEGLPDVDRPRLRVRDGFDATQLILAVAAPLVRVAMPCPYPGMRPYAADDADHFHGRDAEVEELLGRLRAREREIYVIGPSGSGKSSLVGAGILPRLARGVAGLGPFLVRSMRPGERPAERLDELLEVTHGGEAIVTPAEAIAALLAGRAVGSSVLIVIDQLEELFTLADAGERERFQGTLWELRDEPRCVIVFTMRADFFGVFMESPLWTDRRGRISRIEVAPLRGEALCEAIVRPASDLGVDVEPALIERLLADAGSEPGVLPLLQETLVQLWDRRQGPTLTLADYEALGDEHRSGLAVALSRRADATLRTLTPAQEAIARRILLRLVSFGDGRLDTRRQQLRSNLRAAEEDAADFEHVLQRMIADRLLASDGDDEDQDARVDLSHEVMITAWPTLGEWIRSRREDEQHRRVLEAKAAEWVRSGRGQSRLLDADELLEVRNWLSDEKARDLGVNEEMQSLLTHSEAALAAHALEAEGRRRRLRRWVTIALVVLTCAVVAVSTLAVIAVRRSRVADEQSQEAQRQAQETRRQAQEAQRQSQEARRQLARYYVARGCQLLMSSQPAQAAPYLLAARSIDDAAEDVSLGMLFRWATQGLPILQVVHHGRVRAMAFSPDGRQMATASADQTARVWDAASGQPVTPPLAHQNEITAVTFSPDGRRVATASWDQTARVWDAASGQAVTPPLAHQGGVLAVAFSSDGRRVATASADKTARVWDGVSGRPVMPPIEHRGWVLAVVFGPDGRRVATASADQTARVWDAASGRPVTPPLAHDGGVLAVAFSPDGRRVATASEDGTARVWDAASGQPVTPPLAHQGGVLAVAFSPDGRVGTASDDQTARVWDVLSGQPVTPPLAHHGEVLAVAFSPDGRRVATASADQTARVWDAASGRPVTPPLAHHGGVLAMAFSPDGRRVAIASADKTARIWDAASGRPVTPPLAHKLPVRAVAFSLDGQRVATASEDGTARVWDAASGQAVTPPLAHQSGVLAVAFSADGQRVATTGFDQTVQVWDAASGEAVTSPLARQSWGLARVLAVVFSPDGRRVATASDDGTARVWDAASGRPVTPPLAHQDEVHAVAFSPDGRRVATASSDKTARVWDAASGQPVTPPLAHQGAVHAVAFSPDGRRVVTASSDQTARVWDAAWDTGTLADWRATLERSDYYLNNDGVPAARTPKALARSLQPRALTAPH